MKTQLVRLAQELGFDLCRVARCAPPPHREAFASWIDDGGHGEMEYMRRGAEKRSDPQLVLPGAQSVVVLAMNYFQGDAPNEVARYAWGDDYHDVIAPKLRKIDIFARSAARRSVTSIPVRCSSAILPPKRELDGMARARCS